MDPFEFIAKLISHAQSNDGIASSDFDGVRVSLEFNGGVQLWWYDGLPVWGGDLIDLLSGVSS